jgi:hypothetical protein
MGCIPGDRSVIITSMSLPLALSTLRFISQMYSLNPCLSGLRAARFVSACLRSDAYCHCWYRGSSSFKIMMVYAKLL